MGLGLGWAGVCFVCGMDLVFVGLNLNLGPFGKVKYTRTSNVKSEVQGGCFGIFSILFQGPKLPHVNNPWTTNNNFHLKIPGDQNCQVVKLKDHLRNFLKIFTQSLFLINFDFLRT